MTLYPYVSEDVRTAAGPISETWPDGSPITFEAWDSPAPGAGRISDGWLDSTGRPLPALTSTLGAVRVWREDVRDAWIAQAGAPASMRVPLRIHSTSALLEQVMASGAVPTLDDDGHLSPEYLPLDGAASLGDYLDARPIPAERLVGAIPEALIPPVDNAGTLAPSGSTVTAGDARVIVDGAAATHGQVAFPSVVRLGPRRLLAIGHDGKDAASGQVTPTIIRGYLSEDGGGSWRQLAAPILSDPQYQYGFQVTRLRSGRLIGSGQRFQIVNGALANRTNPVYYSDDPTLSTPWEGGAIAADGASSGWIIETAAGTLLHPVYSGNYSSPPSSNMSARIFATSDQTGQTGWAARATISATGKSYTEPVLLDLGDRILCFIRNSTDLTSDIWVSTDDGFTWTDTGKRIPDCDARVAPVLLADGRIFISYRVGPPYAREVYRVMPADLSTLGSPVTVYSPDSRTTYSALVEASPGQVACIVGYENGLLNGQPSGGLAHVPITLGRGVDTVGALTYWRPSQVRAQANPVVLWDTFQRPDTPVGPGSSDCGVRWDGSNDWNIRSNSLRRTAAGTVYAQLPGVTAAAHEVEADLAYFASAEQEVGVVVAYVDTYNNIHTRFAAGKLQVVVRVAGVDTITTQTADAPLATTTTRQNVRLAVRGGQVVAHLNGVPVIAMAVPTASWDALKAATTIGVRSSGAGTEGYHRVYRITARSWA